MTLLFIDGLKDANTVRKTGWSGSWNAIITGRTGDTNGGAQAAWGNNSQRSIYTLPSDAATLIIGFAGNIGSSNGDGFSLGAYAIASGVVQLCAKINTIGQLEVYRGTTYAGTLIATSSGHPPISGWNYYEFKVLLHTSTGSCQVQLNGVQVVNFSGQTAATSGAVHSIGFSSPLTDNTCSYDDFYVCDAVDATGSQGRANNTFLGDVRVASLLPTSAGDTTGWTPSTGTNFGAVDEVPPNTTDYVAAVATSTGTRDLYNVTDLTGTITTVYGVQVSLYAIKTDAGAALIKPVVKENSTVTSQTSQAIGTTYAPLHGALLAVRPSDSAVWTATDVNNLQAGVEIG